jgi:hypothetical protein
VENEEKLQAWVLVVAEQIRDSGSRISEAMLMVPSLTYAGHVANWTLRVVTAQPLHRRIRTD